MPVGDYVFFIWFVSWAVDVADIAVVYLRHSVGGKWVAAKRKDGAMEMKAFVETPLAKALIAAALSK